MRSALAKSLEQAEWHDLVLASPIGQGYVLDLLRQRGPVEHIVLALPAISCGSPAAGDDTSRLLNDVLSETRHAVEGLIAVMRGAEATLDASIGAGLTLLRADLVEASSPMARALGALRMNGLPARWGVGDFGAVAVTNESPLTVESADQQPFQNTLVDLGQLLDIRELHPFVNLVNGLVDVTHLYDLRAAGRNESSI